jgi:hypothetical protein
MLRTSGGVVRRSTSTTCVASLALALSGCAASRAIAPLERGTAAVTASVGGPMFAFGGTPLPTPISTVGVAYGATERTTVHASLHPTGLALFGIFGLDAGAAYELAPPSGARPRLMTDLTLSAFAGDTAPDGAPFGVRVFPEASVIASWDLGRRAHHPYVGLDLFTEPYPTPAAYLSPVAGGQIWLGRVGLQLEGKWIAPYTRNLPSFVEWIGPAHQGALSVQLGLQIPLGAASEESP